MTHLPGLTFLWLALALLVIAAVFMLYQSPLMGIYLANWMLC